MGRGRKAEPGTYEAREKIAYIEEAILSCSISQDARIRAVKAVRFGLGIKEQAEETKDQEENTSTEKVKEKKTTKEIEQDEGDVYFKPEDCQEVPGQE